MVSMLALSMVDRGPKPWSVKPKTKIDICCFSAKHTALRRIKNWLALEFWNQDNVSEWEDMSTHELLFQWASTIKFKLSMLVKYKATAAVV